MRKSPTDTPPKSPAIATNGAGHRKLSIRGITENAKGQVQHKVSDFKDAIDRRYDFLNQTLVLAAITAATRRNPVRVLLGAAAIVFLVTHALEGARAPRQR